jgi:hypothetical protein
VGRLAAYRGVAYVGALTIASEAGDWRRFPAARIFMGFTGLVPSEYSTGDAVTSSVKPVRLVDTRTVGDSLLLLLTYQPVQDV